MVNPKVHENKPKHVLSMINKYNISELNLVDRPIGGTREGFGSHLPQHNHLHHKRYFSTESRDFFGEPHPETQSETLLKQAARMRMAGTISRPFDQQSTKIISNLMGENLVREADPQERVDIQRQWLPQTDIAIKAVNEGNSKLNQTNFFDNSNSLALGEGHQLAFMRPHPNGGYFPRRG